MEPQTRDDELVVEELKARLRGCLREAEVLKGSLDHIGVDASGIIESCGGGSGLTSFRGSETHRVASLEAKVRRLEDDLAESAMANQQLERNYFAARREAVTSGVGRGDRLAELRQELYGQDLRRRNTAPDLGAKSRTQLDLEKALRTILKLKKLLRKRQAELEQTSSDVLQREDVLGKLDSENAHLRQSVALLQKKLSEKECELACRARGSTTLFNDDGAQYDLHFTRRFDLRVPDDSYVTALLQKSQYEDPLAKMKADVSKMLCSVWAKQDATLSTLWKLVNARTAYCPKKEAHKAISEVQRLTKVELHNVAREVNAALCSVMDKEKKCVKDFVTDYELLKLREKEHVGVMCVMTDPPPPIVGAQQKQIDGFAAEKMALCSRIDALESESCALRADNDTLYTAAHATHTQIYHCLKSIWTHRYRFCEGVEDHVRALAMKQYPQRSQHPRSELQKIFRSNQAWIMAKDIEQLDTLAKYVTSDLLYMKDMVVEARHAKEVEARRRNSAPLAQAPHQGEKGGHQPDPPKPRKIRAAPQPPKAAPEAPAVEDDCFEGWGDSDSGCTSQTRSRCSHTPPPGAAQQQPPQPQPQTQQQPQQTQSQPQLQAQPQPQPQLPLQAQLQSQDDKLLRGDSPPPHAGDEDSSAAPTSESASLEDEPVPVRFVRFEEEHDSQCTAAPPEAPRKPSPAVVAWDGTRGSAPAAVPSAAARGSPANYVRRERGAKRHARHTAAAAGAASAQPQHRGSSTPEPHHPKLGHLLRCASISFEMGVAPQATPADDVAMPPKPTVKFR